MYNRYYPYQYNRFKRQSALPEPVAIDKKQKPPIQKRKLDFKALHKNACTSLNDVECFLNNFSSTWKYIRLIKLLK